MAKRIIIAIIWTIITAGSIWFGYTRYQEVYAVARQFIWHNANNAIKLDIELAVLTFILAAIVIIIIAMIIYTIHCWIKAKNAILY